MGRMRGSLAILLADFTNVKSNRHADSRGLEHINIDVASFLASGATAFLKEVNLDSDFKLVIEATAEGEMKVTAASRLANLSPAVPLPPQTHPEHPHP